MFDIAPTELLLVGIVALLVIGPKDLPKAMRFVGHWVGRARGVARQFRSGFDAMVREAELAEMEKKWTEENARIMREHPTSESASQAALPSPDEPASGDAPADAGEQPVVMVEKPVVEPAADAQAAPAADKAPS